MKLKLILIGILFFALSCDNQENSTPHIYIPDLLDSKIDLKLFDIFNTISYTPLESNKETYISRVDGLIMDSDFILVLDNDNQKLLQFKEDGSFAGEFMKKGRGPGEFFEITSIDVNEDRELLILRNGEFLDIMEYDGTVINSIKFTRTPTTAKWVTPEVIALFFSFPSYYFNDGFEISFINKEGAILKNALKHHGNYRERKKGSFSRIGKNGGTLYYWFHQSDTVYTISKSLDVYPRYVFQHDKRNIPVEKYSDFNFQLNFDGQYTVESYDEWGDYIFIMIAYDDHFVRGVIHKNLNLSGDIISEYNKWTYRGFLNDVDGGMPFWPGGKQIDGSVVNALDPMKLRETFEHNRRINLPVDSIKQKDLKNSIIDNLTIMSNPVLMRVK